MNPKISIITLGVKDLNTSTKFYRDGLGFPIKEDFPGISFFTLDGTWLSLYPIEKLAQDAKANFHAEGFKGFTLAHNVRTKEEVDAVIQLAKEAGATILKVPQDTDWGGYSGYFGDPDGYLWEVAWNPHFTI